MPDGHAHALNAPGKFLVSAPEHVTPRRARAYLVTDDDVARTVARYAPYRPRLDDISRAAILPGTSPEPDSRDVPGGARGDAGEPADSPGNEDAATPEDALWLALCLAPDEGADIADLMRNSGLGRSTVYRYLAQLAQDGRAEQVGWGRWRAITTPEDGDDE
jgi:hypothetical protein